MHKEHILSGNALGFQTQTDIIPIITCGALIDWIPIRRAHTHTQKEKIKTKDSCLRIDIAESWLIFSTHCLLGNNRTLPVILSPHYRIRYFRKFMQPSVRILWTLFHHTSTGFFKKADIQGTENKNHHKQPLESVKEQEEQNQCDSLFRSCWRSRLEQKRKLNHVSI